MVSVRIRRAPGKPDRPRLPRPRPRRSALFQPHTHGPRLGMLRLTVGKVAVDYWLSRLPSDFGAAFRLEKFAPAADEPAAYDVLLAEGDGHHSCECQGFLRWGHCKHLESLAALRKAGRI
jgi:hypothetical protein